MGDEWARMNLDWFQAFGPEDKLVIFYSDLVKDTVAVLRRILDFLQVSVSGTTLQCLKRYVQACVDEETRAKDDASKSVFTFCKRRLQCVEAACKIHQAWVNRATRSAGVTAFLHSWAELSQFLQRGPPCGNHMRTSAEVIPRGASPCL